MGNYMFLNSASTLGNGGISDGGPLNNTDSQGAYTKKGSLIEARAALLALLREADGLVVGGGGWW